VTTNTAKNYFKKSKNNNSGAIHIYFYRDFCAAQVLLIIHTTAMNASAFTQHIQACEHIALERLHMAKQYSTLLANPDKHAFHRAHITTCGRIFTAMFGDAFAIDNGYISDEDLFL
jgi:hypothetical protein